MIVVCVGNAVRGDDAAGLEVARRLRGRLPDGVELLEREGEPTGLVDTLAAADGAVVVDCVRSGSPPGTVHRLDAASAPVPAALYRSSTHHLSLAEAIELARALGKLPPTLVLYGIEGERFEPGEGLTASVERAVAEVAERVLADLGA